MKSAPSGGGFSYTPGRSLFPGIGSCGVGEGGIGGVGATGVGEGGVGASLGSCGISGAFGDGGP